jgi:hypothetical protein
MKPLFRDEESRKSFEFPVEYLFEDVPKTGRHEDSIRYTLEEMDAFGIEKAPIGVSLENETGRRAVKCSRDPGIRPPSWDSIARGETSR